MYFPKRQIAISFIWKLLERSGVQGISFVLTIILARILQPSEYGEMALVMVFINLANVIVDGGFSTALIQKKDADERDFSTLMYVSLFISLLLYAFLFAIAPLIAAFYDKPEMIKIVRVISVCVIIFSFNSLQRAYVSRFMKFKGLFKASLSSVLVSGILSVFLAFQGFGIWALVVYQISSSLLLSIVMWFSVDWRPSTMISLKRFKNIYSFGWKILVSNVMIALFVNVRSIIIGKFYTPASLAFFDRGRQFPAIIMENINTSLQTVLLPVFSNNQDDKLRINMMVSRSIKTSCLFIFPLMVLLIVVAKPLVLVLLTEKWVMAVPFVQIFSLAYILMPIQIANLEAIKGIGRSDVILKLETIKKIIEVAILVISSLLGVYAIAWGVVIYNFICIFVNLYPNRELLIYPLMQQIRDVLPQFFASGVMGMLIYPIQYLELSPLTLLICQLLFGIFSYLVICHIFGLESYKYVLNLLYKYKY